jgi:peptide/nickel transport system permease protein
MKFIAKKLALYLFIAWAAITLNFLIPRLMPGDPITMILNKIDGATTDPASLEALKLAFGISDAPLIIQYFEYLGSLLSGNLGISISNYPVPVTEIIASTLPWTVGLIGVTTIVSFVLGTSIGIVLAWRRGSWSDGLLPALTFFNALPYFWMALILVLVFAVTLHWFPLSGGYDNTLEPGWTWEFAGSVIQHALLPAITIVLASFAGWVMGMRNMMITVLGEDYVSLAQAKGLRKRTVMFRYAARNAILPSITSFAIAIGAVVSGSMLTEVIFNYPGIGYALFQGVQNQDYPLMQGMFLVISLTVILANLIADILYVFLDPRTRQEATA